MTLGRSIIEHPRWGRIIVTRNPRARRIIMRARPGAIHMTIPPHATESDIERALGECGSKLLQRQQECTHERIGKDFSIDTPHFKVTLQESGTAGIKVTGSNGLYTIHCPEGTCYADESTQQVLRQGIKAAMKHCAGVLLPPRLEAQARKHGFKYSKCSVRDVRSRWGSCTSRGSISLNTHLVMLDDGLIDYVLLHELCHTVEMNHSERFWALLDRCTAPARAKELRARLKEEGRKVIGL